MNIDAAFPSKYLKAADIGETDLALTIKEVVMETVGQGEEAEGKPIIYFNETEKGLVLNKTNTNTIKGLYSAETDNWVGKTIALFATEVDFAGKQTLALRVRMRPPQAKTNGNGHAPTVADLKARYFERANEAAQMGIIADTIPDDATAEQIITAGKKLKAAIDKANEF
jgi:hypothetical protein